MLVFIYTIQLDEYFKSSLKKKYDKKINKNVKLYKSY